MLSTRSFFGSAPFLVLGILSLGIFVATALPAKEEVVHNSIVRPSLPEPFTDTTYRIQRNFVPVSKAQLLLHQIVYEGVETSLHHLDHDAVQVYGDAGRKDSKFQLEKDQFASAMQDLISYDYSSNQEPPRPADPLGEDGIKEKTKKTSSRNLYQYPQQQGQEQHSLVYYLEKLRESTLAINDGYIQQVVKNTVLETKGTIHLYLSTPHTAALGNHTDTTNIVVLQLHGTKEWLLCQEKTSTISSRSNDMIVSGAAGLRARNSPTTRRAEDYADAMFFDQKLNSCSVYDATEMDEYLDCERTVLQPGDALFLPRRIVHSARASVNTTSAHLTFAYKEEDTCRGDYSAGSRQERMLATCNKNEDYFMAVSCDGNCDYGCDESCNGSCDNDCNDGCDGFFSGCDSDCTAGCDDSCDSGCDAWCDTDCDKCVK